MVVNELTTARSAGGVMIMMMIGAHEIVHLVDLVRVGVASAPRGRHLYAARDGDGGDERERVEEAGQEESVEGEIVRVEVEQPRVELIRLGYVLGHVERVVDEVVELEVVHGEQIEAERGERRQRGQRHEHGEEDERTQQAVAFAATRATRLSAAGATPTRTQTVLLKVVVYSK